MIKTKARYIHGSEDSTDLDVVYVVDGELPSFGDCKNFCDSDYSENRNLIQIEDGCVVACYKGTPDEINNSLLRTYNLHNQNCPLLIEHTLPRNKYLKYVRSVRIILSHFSRSCLRTKIKEALRSSWKTRLSVLREIVSSDIDFSSLNKNLSIEDIKKVIAFQIGQSLGLMMNMELYTKSEISNSFPWTKPYLYRETESVWKDSNLSKMLYEFILYLEDLKIKCDEDSIVTFIDENATITINLIKEKIIK